MNELRELLACASMAQTERGPYYDADTALAAISDAGYVIGKLRWASERYEKHILFIGNIEFGYITKRIFTDQTWLTSLDRDIKLTELEARTALEAAARKTLAGEA